MKRAPSWAQQSRMGVLLSVTGAVFENGWSWQFLAVSSIYFVPCLTVPFSSPLCAPITVRDAPKRIQWQSSVHSGKLSCLMNREWQPTHELVEKAVSYRIGNLLLDHSHIISPVVTEGLLTHMYACEKYWNTVLRNWPLASCAVLWQANAGKLWTSNGIIK